MRFFAPKVCATCAAKDAEIARLANLVHTERQLSDSLTRQVLTDVLLLKRDGFVAKPAAVPVAPAPPEVVDAIERTIREYEGKAPRGANVRGGLELHVARMKAQGATENDILLSIHRGGSYEAEDDE